MLKTLGVLTIGAALGAAIALLALPRPAAKLSLAEVPVRDVDAPAKVSIEAAEALREERFASVETIEDMLALPGDFAETEALYTVAGREDAEGVQRLIFEAARLRDSVDRNAALGILFMRLTELDPASAVAMSRSPAFASNGSIARNVWETWGRLDLDSALAAARAGSGQERYRAAQYLYGSLRHDTVADAARIEAELGIAPSRNANSRLIARLADRSVADAIAYVESHQGSDRQTLIYALARHLGRAGIGDAANYADMLRSAGDRQLFGQAAGQARIEADPAAAAQALLGEPATLARNQQLQSALYLLAGSEPVAALSLLEQLPTGPLRDGVAGMVVAQVAAREPLRALQWVKENKGAANNALLASIITQIAASDPQLAMAEANAIANRTLRSQAVTQAVAQTAQHAPQRAAELLGTVDDPSARTRSVQQIAGTWAQNDYDAALAWAETLSPAERRLALRSMGHILLQYDPDAAMRHLEYLDGRDAETLAGSIATQLADQRSLDAALAFVSRYEGTAGHAAMQRQLVDNVARNDPLRAAELAGRIAEAEQRDQAYLSVVTALSERDPAAAAGWIETIESDAMKNHATQRLLGNWYFADPGAASAWLDRLPRGGHRDAAIAAIVPQVATTDPDSVQRMIDSIQDEHMRRRTRLVQAQSLVQYRPDAARRILSDLDLSESERQQYAHLLSELGL